MPPHRLHHPGSFRHSGKTTAPFVLVSIPVYAGDGRVCRNSDSVSLAADQQSPTGPDSNVERSCTWFIADGEGISTGQYRIRQRILGPFQGHPCDGTVQWDQGEIVIARCLFIKTEGGVFHHQPDFVVLIQQDSISASGCKPLPE